MDARVIIDEIIKSGETENKGTFTILKETEVGTYFHMLFGMVDIVFDPKNIEFKPCLGKEVKYFYVYNDRLPAMYDKEIACILAHRDPLDEQRIIDLIYIYEIE